MLALFLRVFKHLLPRAAAWALSVGSTIRLFFEGLTSAPSDAVGFVDDVHDDIYPAGTRQLSEYESQFALRGTGLEADRRTALDAAWKSTGGQSPRYLQDLVQAAGFNVYIHDWWSSGPGPYVARDPRAYTEQPLIGTVQCGEPLAQCGEPTALCNRWLVNDTDYLVNLNLTPEAPPPVPDDPSYWPFFVYWGTETFGGTAYVPIERRDEFEELLLRVCPNHLWIVTMVDYEIGFLITDGGDVFATEAGDQFIASDN